MAPELETLDQLLGGPMRLEVIQRLYGDFNTFSTAIRAMLGAGEIRLLDNSGEVPSWRWPQILLREDHQVLSGFMLELTPRGELRIS